MSTSSTGPAVTLTLTQANFPNHNQSFDTTDLGTSYGSEEISAGEVAYITGVPEMPDLSASLSGLKAGDTVDWRMEIRSERTERGTADDKNYPATGTTTTTGTQDWDITAEFGTDFVGGRATIYYKVNGGAEKSFEFFIRGKNPLDATARAYVQAHASAATYPYAWGIVQHESRQGNRVYNQFNSGGDGPGNLELPNFGPPNGWGIAQLDNPLGVNASTLEVYNWKKNVDKLYLELDDKTLTTNRFFAAVAHTFSSDPDASNPPSSFTVPNTATAYSAQQLSTMILYNGASGTQSSTLTNPNGTTTTYTNPWKFQTTTTPKWSFQDNVNDYAEEVIGDEIDGGLPTQE